MNWKVIVPAVVLALVLFGGAGYFIYQKVQSQPSAQDEVKTLVSAVGKLMDLPQGESPTIATVTDVTKLKDQPFFQKAKNGDKVLIYAGTRKAILYDPQSKKIKDVVPLNISTSSAQTASPSAKPNF